jgi:hypothetical protein
MSHPVLERLRFWPQGQAEGCKSFIIHVEWALAAAVLAEHLSCWLWCCLYAHYNQLEPHFALMVLYVGLQSAAAVVPHPVLLQQPSSLRKKVRDACRDTKRVQLAP